MITRSFPTATGSENTVPGRGIAEERGQGLNCFGADVLDGSGEICHHHFLLGIFGLAECSTLVPGGDSPKQQRGRRGQSTQPSEHHVVVNPDWAARPSTTMEVGVRYENPPTLSRVRQRDRPIRLEQCHRRVAMRETGHALDPTELEHAGSDLASSAMASRDHRYIRASSPRSSNPATQPVGRLQ